MRFPVVWRVMRAWVRRQWAMSIALALALPACGPKTQNVKAFSASVLDTNGGLESVLALGYPSCVRGAEYHMLKTALAVTPDTQSELQQSYAKRLQTCELTKQVEAQALEAAQVLSAFAAALAQLASDQRVSHVPEQKDAKTGTPAAPATEKPGPAPKEQLGAATNDVVATIAGWVTAGYRKKQLSQAIAESAEPLQTVLTALLTVIDEVNVEGLLQQEEQNLLDLFEIYDLEAGDEPVARALRHLQRQRLHADIRVRLANTQRFRQRLERLRQAHEALVEERGALQQEELLTEVRAALADTFAPRPRPVSPDPLELPKPQRDAPAAMPAAVPAAVPASPEPSP